jgi:hypothetical protein
MIKRFIPIIIISIFLINIASAAGNETLLQPGMGMNWFNAQPKDFKDMIMWVVGGLMFLLGLAFIISSGAAAGKGMLDKSGFGNPDEKSRSNNAMFGILLTLVGVLIFIAVGTGVFSFF